MFSKEEVLTKIQTVFDNERKRFEQIAKVNAYNGSSGLREAEHRGILNNFEKLIKAEFQ